ncbi:hypothetical protein ACRRTK_004400 [Alexandromys fortis]
MSCLASCPNSPFGSSCPFSALHLFDTISFSLKVAGEMGGGGRGWRKWRHSWPNGAREDTRAALFELFSHVGLFWADLRMS